MTNWFLRFDVPRYKEKYFVSPNDILEYLPTFLVVNEREENSHL